MSLGGLADAAPRAKEKKMTPTRMHYEKELAELRFELNQMGTMIEEALNKVSVAFEGLDGATITDIIQGDRAINDKEKHIESRCLSLILKQQPVAKDLRNVSAALKVVTDMERIGDHAADIAEIIGRMPNNNLYHKIPDIAKMLLTSKEMVMEALACFIDQNLKAAESIIQRDDVVDDLFENVKQELITALKEDKENADICLDLLMIGKYLERIGDHAVNICEWSTFQATGEVNDIRIL